MGSLPDVHRYRIEVPPKLPTDSLTTPQRKEQTRMSIQTCNGSEKKIPPSALDSYFKSNNKSKLSSQHGPKESYSFSGILIPL